MVNIAPLIGLARALAILEHASAVEFHEMRDQPSATSEAEA